LDLSYSPIIVAMMLALRLVAVFLVAVYAEKNPFDGDKVFRITPKTDAEVKLLKDFFGKLKNIDAWQEPSVAGNTADVHVAAHTVAVTEAFLEKNGYEYGYLIDNLGSALDAEEASNVQNAFASSFNYERYNTYRDIAGELFNLARQYKNAETFFVGNTYERRRMVGLKVVAPGSTSPKPAIWIDGGIHAREWISPATVMYFLNKLLTSGDSRAKQVLDMYDFYFLPVFNPDGYQYTHMSRRTRLWRKTRSNQGWGCYGADPNRNWGYKWEVPVGTSRNPCSDIYRGRNAFSEIEVKNVANYLQNKVPNLKMYFNVHAYSQLILTPFSYTTDYPEDYPEIKRVADVFVSAVESRYGTYYKAGPPSRILYAVAGGSIDWTYAVLGVKYSYALELRDRGEYGFVLPTDQIKPTGEETSDAWFASILAMK